MRTRGDVGASHLTGSGTGTVAGTGTVIATDLGTRPRIKHPEDRGSEIASASVNGNENGIENAAVEEAGVVGVTDGAREEVTVQTGTRIVGWWKGWGYEPPFLCDAPP